MSHRFNDFIKSHQLGTELYFIEQPVRLFWVFLFISFGDVTVGFYHDRESLISHYQKILQSIEMQIPALILMDGYS